MIDAQSINGTLDILIMDLFAVRVSTRLASHNGRADRLDGVNSVGGSGAIGALSSHVSMCGSSTR